MGREQEGSEFNIFFFKVTALLTYNPDIIKLLFLLHLFFLGRTHNSMYLYHWD